MENELYRESAARTRLLAGSEQLTVTIYSSRLELLVQSAKSTDTTVVEFAAVERYLLDESQIRIVGAFLKNGFEKVSEVVLEHPLSIIKIINVLYLVVPTLVRDEGDLDFRRRLQSGMLDESVPKGVIHFEFGASVKSPPNIYVNRCVIRTVPVGSALSRLRHDLYLPYDKYEIYVDVDDDDILQESNTLIVTLSEACPEIGLKASFGLVNLKLKKI